MQNVSTRQARTGRGAAVLALVAVVGTVGYGLGQTRSSQATASAAVSPRVTTALATTAPATSYAGVVNAVAPAVVTVRVEKKASPMPTDMPQLPDDPMLREFFGRRFQTPQQPRIPRQSGLGSGVITSADGYILTNNHVIDGADRVRVELTDSRTFDGKVIGTDPASDLALLKIEASNLPTLQIGDSSKVNVGDVVLAIGNPLGVGQAVTMGIISAKGRSTGLGDGYEDFLQTDAPINHGNSGGALINLNGELVGINSQILSPTGGNIGLGFAIPANMARQVMDQLKTDGRVSRGKLGVTIQSVTSDIAENLKLGAARGALVSAVEPGSPAARAGVRQGDVVVAVDGEQLADSNALRNRIAGTRPGSNVALEIVRDGRSQTLNATLDTLRPAVADRLSRREGADSDDFGLTVEALTPERARELELTRRTEGVFVRGVDPNGAAAASGLRAGDVIAQVNRQPVKSPSELRAALAKATDRPALLLVTRGNADLFLTIRNR